MKPLFEHVKENRHNGIDTRIKKMERMTEGMKSVDNYANASAKGVSCTGKEN